MIVDVPPMGADKLRSGLDRVGVLTLFVDTNDAHTQTN
jgi:hypothetical protein